MRRSASTRCSRSTCAESDVVISTAQIPNRKAPILVTADMVASMRSGSVIVDLAAPGGGNCELTRPDEEVVDHGVLILGPTNLPASIPGQASQLYSHNATRFVNQTPQGRTAASRFRRRRHQPDVHHARRQADGRADRGAAAGSERVSPAVRRSRSASSSSRSRSSSDSCSSPKCRRCCTRR